MEHSVHTTTRALVEAIVPTPIHLVKCRLGQQAYREDEDDEDLNMIGGSESDDDDNSDDNFKSNLEDILGKVLTFVNHVHLSPQAHKYFQRLYMEENVMLQLLKWVQTRWASLYDLIT